MRTLIGWGISFIFFGFGIFTPGGQNVSSAQSMVGDIKTEAATVTSLAKMQTLTASSGDTVGRTKLENQVSFEGIVFKWGDVSWLPELASRAGWPAETHEKLSQIVLRESGGCPNRRGGDMVDKNCIITGVSEWNHRSDTGLLQINGVNYNTERNKWAIACLKMQICKQAPLLDPLTNLKVGYLLYAEAGWGPWDPCTWGEKYAKRCKAEKSKP